jgi:hypothetical protein
MYGELFDDSSRISTWEIVGGVGEPGSDYFETKLDIFRSLRRPLAFGVWNGNKCNQHASTTTTTLQSCLGDCLSTRFFMTKRGACTSKLGGCPGRSSLWQLHVIGRKAVSGVRKSDISSSSQPRQPAIYRLNCIDSILFGGSTLLCGLA